MGSVQSFETPKSWGGRPGKIDAPLNKKLSEVKWGDFRIGDLFEVRPTKSYGLTNTKLFATAGDTPVVTNTGANNGVSGRVALPPTEKGGIITYSDTTTSDAIFYQSEDFIGYSHVQGLYPKQTVWNRFRLLYFVAAFKKAAANKFDYGNKFNRAITTEMYITLPVTLNSEIDFEFIDNFIVELEAQRIVELEAYLTVAGLKDYVLTKTERNALYNYKNWEWNTFNLEDLFGKSTRGKRLKSADRIPGELPFVTAGEADEGISDFIGNDVTVFSENTTTIDMFGSAKYRNYRYGGDDHVAIVHTEALPKLASIFVTSAIHKSSHNGQFDYSKNFYAKDADALNIKLPSQNGVPDYDRMATFISAVQKEVIKDVVLFANRKIEVAKEIVNK